MQSYRRSAPSTRTIDWTALSEHINPEFCLPMFSGDLLPHVSDMIAEYQIDSGGCRVVDVEATGRDTPHTIDGHEKWEEDWSDTVDNYSTPDQEDLQVESVNMSQKLVSPWIVHVPRMERELENIGALLGRVPTDRELAESMGLGGVNGLACLFLLIGDLGGTLCTQRHPGACPTELARANRWLLRSLRFRALRVEIHKALRSALCDASAEDNLHVSLHYRDEPHRESATLEIFCGSPGQRDVVLDIYVCADDHVCSEQQADASKVFQVTTYATQNGALRRGSLWERFHDHVRSRCEVTSWYCFRANRPPVRWQRQIDYHVTLLSM